MKRIPVFFIDGLLDSGKTSFIIDTLKSDLGENMMRTLLIVCEEGEVEYEPEFLEKANTVKHVFEKEEDFSYKVIEQWVKEVKPDRIVMEMNGMWELTNLQFPKNIEIVQVVDFIDASTFGNYYKNMSNKFTEIIKRSHLVCFTKCDDPEKQIEPYKQALKLANNRCQYYIMDENMNASDAFKEPLPYDVNADVIKINQARGMLGFTGYYNGKRITVMGSGMGMPSMGIYSYELFKFYDVKTIIRIGTAGAYSKDLNLFDVLLAKDAYSESTFASVMGLSDSNVLAGSTELNALIMKTAEELEIDVNECRIHSSDVFYCLRPDYYKEVRDNFGCLAVEMETFALYANAMALNKRAATILTVSNSFETNEEMSSLERQNSLNEMMKLALEVAIRC